MRLARDFVYLAAVVGWFSRKVLCLETLDHATTSLPSALSRRRRAKYGKPEIFNTD